MVSRFMGQSSFGWNCASWTMNLLYFGNHCNIYGWTKRSMTQITLADLWHRTCWGHICNSTQESLRSFKLSFPLGSKSIRRSVSWLRVNKQFFWPYLPCWTVCCTARSESWTLNELDMGDKSVHFAKVFCCCWLLECKLLCDKAICGCANVGLPLKGTIKEKFYVHI